MRYFLIAVVAFTLGGATIVEAAPPIVLSRLADGVNAARLASIDAAGNLQVRVSNLPATQPVNGTVSVGNFPASQAISGSVSVSNLPATQPISGTVNIGNFPNSSTDEPYAVDGTCVINAGSNSCNSTFAPTPPGKRLIVDFVSVRVTTGTGNPPTNLEVDAFYAGAYHGYFFPITLTAADASSGNAMYVTSQQTRLFHDSNGGSFQVNMAINRAGTSGFLFANLALSGHLVSIQ